MSPATIRRTSDTDRVRSAGGGGKRWLALALVVFALAAAAWLFSRDVDWEARGDEVAEQGQTAENNGNYEAAKRFYKAALAGNPYAWQIHLSLANLLNHRMNENDEALRHYLYALAYSPDPDISAKTKNDVEILKMIRSGELENPIDAVEDMFLAVESGVESAFYHRLSPGLRKEFPAYWKAWNERGRGTVTFRRISSENDGFYDAVLNLEFPDTTSMSMHLDCPARDVWKLSLSFP